MDYAVETAEKRGLERGKIEIAKNLLKVGLDIKTIALSTGLTIETIKKLSSF